MKRPFETLLVIGLGYVGLPTAATLSNRGVRVLGVDINPDTVSLINQGKIHIIEPDLDIMVQNAVAKGTLSASTTPEEADAFIIAVPTPFSENHAPDLSHLKAASESLAPYLKKGDLVVVESTSPVGATEQVSKWLAALCPHLTFPHQTKDEADIMIAHSPERVLPGRVLEEIVHNDRVVGGITRRCAERAAELYSLFVQGRCFLCDSRTAELVKLAENAYRDVNIAFANELALVSERLNIDPWEAVSLANRHPRVNILSPGPGVGGHCIAVDPWFIVDSAPEETTLIKAARQINDARPEHVAEKILAAAKDNPEATIACLGLSYKADIDDLRESPALKIVQRLAERSKNDLLVVEPHIEALPADLSAFPKLRLVDFDEALDQAKIIVLLVDHQAFKLIDPSRLDDKVLFDTRGFWRKKNDAD
jgi:UDP-N-acetyl-D-mannosaminuronic acid dehydrogenase